MAFVAYPATPDFHKFRISVNKSFGKQAGDYAEATRSLKRTYTGSIKLHGTNITILFTNSSRTPQFQSRNRIITPADDNQGAAKWLADTDLTPLLLEIFKIRGIQDGKFEEIFIAGEWAGAGIQSGVALTLVQRFFAIFNIRIDGHWVDIREYKTVQLLDRRIFNVANFTMYEIEFDLADTNDAKKALETMKAYTMEVSKTCPVGAELFALEAPDVATSKSKKVVQRNSTGEGIVWTMVPTPEDDTNLYNFKTKGEQFLTTTKATNNPNNRGTSMAKAEAFVDFALGERRFEQGIEYLVELGKDPLDIKWADRFKKWVVEDVMKEEGWRLDETWEPEEKQAEDGGDEKGVEFKSGMTLKEQGVTPTMVRAVVAERAIKWYKARRQREISEKKVEV